MGAEVGRTMALEQNTPIPTRNMYYPVCSLAAVQELK